MERQEAAAMPPKDIEFNHVIVYVKDVKTSLDFYRELLGFETIEEYGEGYARLRSPKGNTTIALHQAERDEPPSKGRRVVMYFEVKDLEGFCRKLARRGVKFDQMPEPMPWGWKHAYLRDPDVHELSLYRAGKKRFEKTPPMTKPSD